MINEKTQKIEHNEVCKFTLLQPSQTRSHKSRILDILHIFKEGKMNVNMYLFIIYGFCICDYENVILIGAQLMKKINER